MADLALSIGNPMASKTCDALTEPTMQAEPLDAQTPSKSSAMSIVSESTPMKTYVERVGKPMNWIAILLRVWEKLCDACPEIITQLRLALPLCIGVAQHPLGSRSHSRDAGDVFCPGAPLIFVRAAEHEWLNWQTASQEQKSRSLWTVKFMRGKTAGID